MGIVNVTPDSFSDGARHASATAAVAYGLRLIDDGADILDVGGESTRPGATPIDAAEEIGRVTPVIAGLRARTAAPISVDTMKPDVARAAMAAGATLWNDVTALTWSADSPAAAAHLGCEVVLMHMQGEPATMQDNPRYGDVVEEVLAFLLRRAALAQAAGVARGRIWLDPGIGFGKTTAHNLALMRSLGRLVETGYPILLGASRKGFVRALDPRATTPADRLGGSLALALAGGAAGVAAIRAHDVRETIQALIVQGALRESPPSDRLARDGTRR